MASHRIRETETVFKARPFALPSYALIVLNSSRELALNMLSVLCLTWNTHVHNKNN